MKLGSFFVLSAVIALLFGIPLVLAPGTVANLYGNAPTPAVNLAGRYWGSALIGLGLISWHARKVSELATQRAVLLAFLVGNITGAVISVMGTLSGVLSALGWSSVLLYLVMGAGDAYFYLVNPSKS